MELCLLALVDWWMKTGLLEAPVLVLDDLDSGRSSVESSTCSALVLWRVPWYLVQHKTAKGLVSLLRGGSVASNADLAEYRCQFVDALATDSTHLAAPCDAPA